MKPFVGAALILALLATACGPAEKKSSSSADTATTNSAVGENPLNAPAEYLGAMSKAKRAAVKTVDIASVQRAIQMFNVSEGRNPSDLNELVSQQYMPALPAPPHGMKYDYNAQSGQVRLVAQAQ